MSKRAAAGAAGHGRGKASKVEAPAEPQIFRGVVMLAAPSIGGLMRRIMPERVVSRGGVMASAMAQLRKVGAEPTHVVVDAGSTFESAAAERDAMQAPPAARLVTLDWVHKSLGERAMLDAADFEPRHMPVGAAARGRSPSPKDESWPAAGGAGGGGGAAFEPPPPSGAVCAKEGCGRALQWFELGPRCAACLRADGASSLLRMLHLRFLARHPNAALVAALQELADYEELFGEKDAFRSAEAFRRAAAALKTTPRDVSSVGELAALDLPFIGDKMRDVYLKQFWQSGAIQRLEQHRTPAKRAARRLARLPYVGGPAAAAWANHGLDSGEKVLAAERAGWLKARTGHGVANDYARLALEHGEELLQDICTDDHAPLMAAVAAAINIAVPRRESPEGGDYAASRPEIMLVGGARRGKEASHDLDVLVVLPRDGAAHAGALLRALRALADDETVERDARGAPRLVAGLAIDASVARLAAAADEDTPSPRKTSRSKHGGGGGAADSSRWALKMWRGGDGGGGDPELRAANKALILVKMRGLPLRHVDLLVVPYHQRAFWLLGWTGSREFERLLRGYVKGEGAAALFGAAEPKLTLKLSNTALGSDDDARLVTKRGELVPAAALRRDYVDARAYPETEEELFAMLRLPYREPTERNA